MVLEFLRSIYRIHLLVVDTLCLRLYQTQLPVIFFFEGILFWWKNLLVPFPTFVVIQYYVGNCWGWSDIFERFMLSKDFKNFLQVLIIGPAGILALGSKMSKQWLNIRVWEINIEWYKDLFYHTRLINKFRLVGFVRHTIQLFYTLRFLILRFDEFIVEKTAVTLRSKGLVLALALIHHAGCTRML